MLPAQLSFSSSKIAPAQKGGFLSKAWKKAKDVATVAAKPILNVAAAAFPVLAPVAVAAQYIK